MMSILVITGELIFVLLIVLIFFRWGKALFIGVRGLAGLLGFARKADQSPRVLAETSGLDYQERGPSSVAGWIEHSSPTDLDISTQEVEVFDILSGQHRGYHFEMCHFTPVGASPVRVQMIELPRALPSVGATTKRDTEVAASDQRFAAALLSSEFMRAAEKLSSRYWRITNNRLFNWQETSSYHAIPQLKNIDRLVDMAESIPAEVWDLYGGSSASER